MSAHDMIGNLFFTVALAARFDGQRRRIEALERTTDAIHHRVRRIEYAFGSLRNFINGVGADVAIDLEGYP